MSSSKMKNVTPTQQAYQRLAQKHELKRPVLKNCIRAFFIGGLICFFGQGVQTMYYTFFDFTERTAGNPTVATLIFIAVLLTGFGVYDRFAQFAGAGTAVPVTGFANSVASAAIEHRTEGYVLGVGGNMFKLAGSVIVFGTVAAFIIAIIKTVLLQWGGL
ncbi:MULTISPECIES: stage V sporulation protein AC [Alkalihalophilus]|uniref:SpoVA family protein n=2 Tax=Alkalihalophilus pseudofirmus TaxID=79885 RepID=D3FZW3_ALKPO|nr:MULTISPECIES: stage V sporulation protein AC [Alkalihalophilus]ADC51048.1 SpoVA family protein [Alkalihalophilus pseudofirmus OF4]MDV2884242.1 stage V sporulation protein AC [Alkalihalophilus pseudofirmus]MEC2070731.1 stage V sporulation protein AC [Alkalihalophilus marmarensis]WEG18251.1 stage V sporulation protein AC [Alkalihalophilus pseudofirmus]